MKSVPTIDKYMTAVPHTIGAEQTLAKAEKMMNDYKIRHLPVLKGGQLVGILSEGDVRLVESFRDVDLGGHRRAGLGERLHRGVAHRLRRVRHADDDDATTRQSTRNHRGLQDLREVLVVRQLVLLLLVLVAQRLRFFAQIAGLRLEVAQHVAGKHVGSEHDSDRQREKDGHDRDHVVLEVNHR